MQTNIPRIDIDSLSEHKEDEILISRFAAYLAIHPNLTLPHRHSFYHLLFFTEGGGMHTIDFNHFEVKPYQIYFMVPGQVHSWDFKGNVDGFVVNFSGDFFQSFLLRPEYLASFSFFKGISQESVINLSEKTHQTVNKLFENLIEHYIDKNVLREDMIRVLLLQIFICIEQSTSINRDQNIPFKTNILLSNFHKLIEKNFVEIRLPGEYAELLNITPNHLNALCKENMGLQAGEVIRNRVVLEAKRLLVNLGLSVSEIAYKLNFNDNSYFTKFFKKEVGMSPEVFRKKSTLESGKH
ncbi:AraC family transcriptional regulator [Dyadobacter sp. CY356]|uniref:AraC family transcriptional regulator n=1 Tax=Dyadobacter sp. CY356 TaxID=2906442 RepID=UPI001F394754|nr:helix-turn-helix domain-containing protein [Dyadobacter sp. CY356]MCF0059252.1 AraC family transcriptional regulator [Dyadobacter sp. CY356]